MRKLLLSIVILLSLSACKEPAETTSAKDLLSQDKETAAFDKNYENEDMPYESPSESYELVKAACYGNNQSVKELLEKDISIINKESFFPEEETTHTPLSCALTGTYKEGYTPKHREVVKTLLEYGVDVNQPDPSGQDPMYCTPLQLAVRANDLEIAKLLVEKGADVNLTVRAVKLNDNGTRFVSGYCRSSLEIAEKKGNTEMIEWLLSVGADKNQEANEIILQAGQEEYAEIVQLLKQAGAKEGSHIKKEASALKYRIDVELKEPPIDFSSYKGTLPLDEEGNPILWSVLIKEENKNKAREYQKRIGAGKKITPQELHDALLEACRDKNQYAVKVLLDAGANMSDGEWSKVIWEKVVYTDNPADESPDDINETLVLLLAAEAKADGPSLVEASQYGFLKAVKTLLATDGIEKKDISKALLEGIAENVYWPENKIEIVKALLDAGADPNITDEYGYSALHAAEKDSKIVQLLKQAGAKE